MTFRWEGSKLIIEIDNADKGGSKSKSGKMTLTGSSHGWTPCPSPSNPTVKISLNIGY